MKKKAVIKQEEVELRAWRRRKRIERRKEDEEIRSKHGVAALRQARLARIAHEALDQGFYLHRKTSHSDS